METPWIESTFFRVNCLICLNKEDMPHVLFTMIPPSVDSIYACCGKCMDEFGEEKCEAIIKSHFAAKGKPAQ